MSMQEENEDGELLCFSAVATKLLGIVTAPVRYALITKQTQVCVVCNISCDVSCVYHMIEIGWTGILLLCDTCGCHVMFSVYFRKAVHA